LVHSFVWGKKPSKNAGAQIISPKKGHGLGLVRDVTPKMFGTQSNISSELLSQNYVLSNVILDSPRLRWVPFIRMLAKPQLNPSL